MRSMCGLCECVIRFICYLAPWTVANKWHMQYENCAEQHRLHTISNRITATNGNKNPRLPSRGVDISWRTAQSWVNGCNYTHLSTSFLRTHVRASATSAHRAHKWVPTISYAYDLRVCVVEKWNWDRSIWGRLRTVVQISVFFVCFVFCRRKVEITCEIMAVYY